MSDSLAFLLVLLIFVTAGLWLYYIFLMIKDLLDW